MHVDPNRCSFCGAPIEIRERHDAMLREGTKARRAVDRGTWNIHFCYTRETFPDREVSQQ
jgi:hypothetical protein